MKKRRNYFLFGILGGLATTLLFFGVMGELWMENGEFLTPYNQTQGINVTANAYAWVNGSKGLY